MLLVIAQTENKAVYTEGLVVCCWAGAVTILYTRHQALAVSLLIVVIAQIVLLCQFGSFLVACTQLYKPLCRLVGWLVHPSLIAKTSQLGYFSNGDNQ